jgi:integrase
VEAAVKRSPYKSRPPEGSIAELIQFYRANSPEYDRFAPNTRQYVDKVLGDFLVNNGRQQASDLTKPMLVRMQHALGKTPAAANNAIKVIAALYAYGMDTGFVTVNPALKIKRLPPKHPGGFRTWREDEIDAFESHWATGSLPRMVFGLALCTGAAAVDLVKLGWHSVDGERLRYRRQKTERRKGAEETPVVNIPILPELREVLDAADRGSLTFLEHDGHPRSPGGLNHSFRIWVDQAGLEALDRHGRRLTLHGLRKALGRRLAERGASPHVLMSWLGHESVESVQTYTKAYDRETAADAGAELLGAPKPTNVTRLKRER